MTSMTTKFFPEVVRCRTNSDEAGHMKRSIPRAGQLPLIEARIGCSAHTHYQLTTRSEVDSGKRAGLSSDVV